MGMKKTVYGIDLGTTYSCLAYIDEQGEVRVVENPNGQAFKRILPSAVFFAEDGVIVGEEAKNNAKYEPERFRAFFKRDMGETDIETGEVVKYEIAGKFCTPQELSARVLAKITDIANEVLHQEVKDVVVTVPAYFGLEARNATKQAIEIAGLNCINMIDEPVAAAIAYQHTVKQSGAKNILVYDLGGGTFDAALVKVTPDTCETIAHHGDPRLGGADWDTDLLDSVLLAQCSETFNIPCEKIIDDAEFYQELMLAAETLKRGLTDSEKAKIVIRGKKISVSREEFDAVTAGHLESTIGLIHEMYALGAESGKKHPQPDMILLVGGSTRMPQIKKRLEEEFSGVPIESYDPDEAVAKGAAIFASKCNASSGAAPVSTRIGASKSYGMVLIGDDDQLYVHNYIVMNSDTAKPVKGSVYTTQANQRQVSLEIYENIYESVQLEAETDKDDDGSRLMINDRFCLKKIGKATLVFAQPMPQNSPINIIFDMSNGNMLQVVGEDPKSGAKQVINVKLQSAMNEDLMRAARQEISEELRASKE